MLPPPDVDQPPQFAPELAVVEVMFGDEGWARVSITRDARNIYRVHAERWDVSDLTVTGHAYWNLWGHGSSLTDDIEIARNMARDALRTIPRSSVAPYDGA